jgi:DMSO/TMAO reductase YedYZ molybdopterin-dependent catalytic subunit
MSTAAAQGVRTTTSPHRPMHWTACVVGGLVATAAAMAVMFWLRFAYQIRTLPERVMEWVLLFVSPRTLEQGISQFGASAKVYALYLAVAGMAAILLALGVALLRSVRSPWALAAAGPALYLVAMGVVMPVTGAGPFGLDLLQDWRLVNAGYLLVALTFATIVILVRPVADLARPVADRRTPDSGAGGLAQETSVSRRTAVVSMSTTALAAVATVWFGQRGAASGSSLPLARIQVTPQAEGAGAAASALPRPAAPPQPAGAVTGSQVRTTAPATSALPTPLPATAAPAIVSSPTPTSVAPSPSVPAAGSGLPRPLELAKQLARDENGAIVGGARQPGTLASLLTPTEHHYHVTKNPVSDPVIKPEEWSLAFDGEVNTPVRVDYATLRQLPSVELVKTLECISNPIDMCENTEFGCELIGTANWKGVRLVTLLDLAGGVKPGSVAVSIVSEDEYSSTISLEAALDPNTIVAYEMNGTVLPYQHGYPARLLVPGRYGYKSAKWIRVIRPARQFTLDWYGQRNWNTDGFVHTMTRVDVPAPSATLPAGNQRLAGIAYAADRGISKVEYSADGGQTWAAARLLEPQPGPDAWVRWEGTFSVAAGAVVDLVARATDSQGVLQEEASTPTYPDGATGWHHLTVTGA